MSRRTKIISLITISAIVMFLLIWFIIKKQVSVIQRGLDVNTSLLPQTRVKEVNNPSPSTTTPVVQERPQPDLTITLKSLASLFAERYGSFSNQSNFKNLKDLFPLMTDELAVRQENHIKRQAAAQADNSVYYGITSKTVKGELITLDEAAALAEARLTMQRREAKGSMNSNVRVFYQDIVVELKKERGEWRISEIEWQNDEMRESFLNL